MCEMAKHALKLGPMVSIIVPVYNAAEYIEEAFYSVTAQTYRNWELILVDDASTDTSRDCLRRILEHSRQDPELSGKVRVFFSEQNKGPAAARNTGLRAARGRFVAYLDADDLWKPAKLEAQVAFMQRGGYAFGFTGYEFADSRGHPNGRTVRVPKSLTYREALGNTTISTITVMFDREQIPDWLLAMPEDSLREDTAAWWRILRHGYTAYGLNEALSVYRRHDGSYSANKWKAVRGTWKLYRENEGMTVREAGSYFVKYLIGAVRRRI